MLNYLIKIYNGLPPFLLEFLRPAASKFHDFLANKVYFTDQNNEPLYLPVVSPEQKTKKQFIRYKHKFITPPFKKQFRNNFFPNDYSDIEEKASLWEGKPTLKASIIVASYNQKATLELNLLAWSYQTYPLDLIEVVVADDGSADSTKELVSYLQNKVSYKLKFYTHEDKGFRLARVRNEGVSLSSGDVVFFVDADTIPSREYIWEHMKYYHVAENVSVVGMRHRIDPKVIKDKIVDKKMLDSLRELPMIEDPDAPENVKKWRRDVLFNNEAFKKQWSVWGGFHGTLTSCRRRDFVGIGGNDENFTAYGQEDSEVGFRLLAKVQYLISNPKARLYHIEHPTNPHVLEPKNIALLEEKTNGPKVTVYIPAYNAEERIERAIESVLHQTLDDIELIVVNDGSTDTTSSVIEKYRYHPKIRLYSQTHRGKGAASNLAVLYSRGRYICPVGQNDSLMTNALEVLSGELDKDDHLGLVYAGYNQVKNGEHYPTNPKEYRPGSFLINEVVKPMMWKKGYFVLTEGFNENISGCVEYDIALKLEELCRIRELNSIVYKSRRSIIGEEHSKAHSINSALRRRGIKLKVTSYNQSNGILFNKQ